jgi:hypothetical protein
MDTAACFPSKRIKLESSPTPPPVGHNSSPKSPEEDHCSICLQHVVDRTIVPTCSQAHEFCSECLLVCYFFFLSRRNSRRPYWLLKPSFFSPGQSRKCPLCSQLLGDHLIHHIRSKYDYQKHYLPPLRTSPRPPQPRHRASGRRAEREWGRRERQEREEADKLDLAIARRRRIYQHHLYAKVCLPQYI